MFDTLLNVKKFHGESSRAIVWAHNSHIGNAAATEMSMRGEHNIGQLCRKKFTNEAYNIGFGTDHGTVAAASNWDGPMEIKRVRSSHPQSYEYIFHLTNEPGLMLPLRSNSQVNLYNQLMKPKLERAIGVVYRPETELSSHYFEAVLPNQFDEYIWIDQTKAITPLSTEQLEGLPDTYPFGV
jgi:protein-L-isoaspartate(D-aspartate) O-methyltransferase